MRPVLTRPTDYRLDPARRAELVRMAADWPSWILEGRQLVELDALARGFLAPLAGYGFPATGVAPSADEPGDSAWVAQRAAFPLEVSAGFARQLDSGSRVALRDAEGVLLAVLTVEERRESADGCALAGSLEPVELPAHEGLDGLRLSPREAAARARSTGFGAALAYAAGPVLHAGIRAALADAAGQLDAALLVLLPSGAGDGDEAANLARLRALAISAEALPAQRTMTTVFPLADAGALVRVMLCAHNCGATHLGLDESTLDALDARDRAELQASERALGLRIVPLRSRAYSPALRRLIDPAAHDDSAVEHPPSPAEMLAAIAAGGRPPEWLLSDAEVDALRRAYVPARAPGLTLFFTGLSGSGKSTLARAVRARIMEATGRPVTLLDGDRVRRHLSAELGFSREDRNTNILRIGWVAAEITRHGGIAVCAPIAPYDAVRRQVRRMVEPVGRFLLVHVSTPLDVCEARDRKGLYARARAGLLPQFTGVSDPYETPADAELTIDTTSLSIEEAAEQVLAALRTAGLLSERT